MKQLKEGIYTNIQGKEFIITKPDTFSKDKEYKVESIDKENIRYLTQTQIEIKFKWKGQK